MGWTCRAKNHKDFNRTLKLTEMTEDIKKLLKHSATYGTGIVLGKLVGFIMLPIYTRLLTPEDYGVYHLLVFTTSIISMIIGVGISHAVLRFYYQYENQKDRNEVISTALFSNIFIFSFFFIFLFQLSPFFSNLVLDDRNYTFFFKLIFFNLLLSAGYEVPLAFIRAQQKSTKFVTLSLISLILHLSLNIYFVVILKKGVLGILYSNIIASVLTSMYLSFDTFKQIRFHFSICKAKELFKYGAPLIISNIGGFILTFSDRYFLKFYGTLADVGIYSLGYKFGMLMSILILNPFNQIWSAQMFEVAKKHNSSEIYSKVFTYFSLVLVVFGLFISLFTKDIIRLMANPTFWDAYKVVPVIVLAYVIYGFFILSVVGILVSKRTGLIAYITVVACCANLLSNYLLIPRFAMMGAAWATVISFLIRFFGAYFVSQRIMPLSYDWSKICKLFFLAIIFYFFSKYIDFNNPISSIAFNSFIFLIFLLTIYKINIFNNNEKMKLLLFIRNPITGIKQLKSVSS